MSFYMSHWARSGSKALPASASGVLNALPGRTFCTSGTALLLPATRSITRALPVSSDGGLSFKADPESEIPDKVTLALFFCGEKENADVSVTQGVELPQRATGGTVALVIEESGPAKHPEVLFGVIGQELKEAPAGIAISGIKGIDPEALAK